jgi:hypothetical protein
LISPANASRYRSNRRAMTGRSAKLNLPDSTAAISALCCSTIVPWRGGRPYRASAASIRAWMAAAASSQFMPARSSPILAR